LAARKTETGCRPAELFGLYACEPERMQRIMAVVRAADLPALQAAAKADPPAKQPLYEKRDGVAVIDVSGPLTKHPHSFQSLVGGTSTLQVREALRAANADQDVRAILLHVESPGGSVNGLAELYDSISSSGKPVHAHADDIMASGALWLASAAESITANRSAMVGSIGAYVAIEDTSGVYDKAGVKVHVVSSGGVKGGLVDGAPISEEYLAEVKARIDSISDLFVSEVAQGRGLSKKRVSDMADGRMHLASAAKELGLIDGIASFDEAFLSISRKAMNEEQLAAKAAEDAKARVEAETKLAELQAQMTTMASQVKAANDALAQVAHEKAVAAVQAKLATLKSLPAQAGLAEALVTLQNAAPEAFAVLETHLSAWNAQSKTGALFQETGTSASGSKVIDVNNPEEFRAAADEMVAQGKYKTRPEAQKAILREQLKGGN
jgi:capsid assembly protease